MPSSNTKIGKILSWNVNSIKTRLPLVNLLIAKENPDILILQETKSTDESFPHEALQEYNCYTHGQPGYNGVAILTKKGFNVELFEPIKLNQTQARCMRIKLNNIYIYNVYVPCGGETAISMLPKIFFFNQLTQHLLENAGQRIIIAGDFNVAMTDKDIEFPEKFRASPLCLPEFRELMNSMMEKCNLIDTFKAEPDAIKHSYTWWHYFGYKGYSEGYCGRNYSGGLRIDYIFCTEELMKKNIIKLTTLRQYRDINIKSFIKNKEVETKPSDHVPLRLIILDE